jgi:molybdopterin synthase catalytic subunit
MIEITEHPIDTTRVLASVRSDQAGANLLFGGTTREFTGDQQTVRLEYDAYRTMALKEMKKLAAEANSKWELTGCSLVHKVGTVGVGEASVAIAVSSAHRDSSFAAGRWLIDQLKIAVPIWKQEHWADGSTAWVHPSQPADSDATMR